MRASIYPALLLIAAVGCGPRTPTTAEIDPALARLIPSDTLALVDVKADALRTTPLFQKYVAERLQSLKVTDDVSEALAVSNGKDVTIFTKGKSGIALYDQQGNKSAPPARSGGVPPALRGLLRGIPAQNQIFGAGLGSAIPAPDAMPQPGNLVNVVKALQTWTLAADLRSSVKMQVDGVYKTEADAKQIHDALRGLLGIARLSTPSDAPEMLRVWDGIQITMEKATLHVSTDISADLVEKAVERVRRKGTPGRSPLPGLF